MFFLLIALCIKSGLTEICVSKNQLNINSNNNDVLFSVDKENGAVIIPAQKIQIMYENQIRNLVEIIKTMNDTIQQHPSKIDILESKKPVETFIHWGHTECPQNLPKVTKLYQGAIASARFDKSGGTSDYLCLPNNPNQQNITTTENVFSQISPTELERHGFVPGLNAAKANQDLLCSECQIEANNIKTFAAKSTCHGDWKPVYHGWLNSEFVNHHRRQSICLSDEHIKAQKLFPVSENGGTLYFTQVKLEYTDKHNITRTKNENPFGSEYTAGMILRCVVCYHD